ncbi:MAG TPA: hypothetical protein VF846_11370 [Thermoanaerobaculia bacterium]|jgi:type II secretory pathway pseudopilin PulG
MAYCAYCGSYVAGVSSVPCASCGKPTNGAPPRPPAPPAANTVALIVGVAVGGIGLLATIGIVAAIAIPNLLIAKQRPQQQRTIAGIRTMAAAVDSYIDANNEVPDAATPDELRRLLVPKHAASIPKDGWDNDLRYAALPQGYAIASGGADGHVDRPLNEYKVQQGTLHLDCDIVFAYGKFVQYPASAYREAPE